MLSIFHMVVAKPGRGDEMNNPRCQNHPNSGWTPIQAMALQKITPSRRPAGSRQPAVVLLCIFPSLAGIRTHNAADVPEVGANRAPEPNLIFRHVLFICAESTLSFQRLDVTAFGWLPFAMRAPALS